MTLGSGVAIAAIWSAVAAVTWASPFTGVVAVCGAVMGAATLAVLGDRRG